MQLLSTSVTQQKTFQAFLTDLLPQLDKALANAGKSVSERPMEAARFIVDEVIVDIKGDTKDNYMEKPWFALIFLSVQNWFKKRYGIAQVHPKRDAHGVVKHFGALYLLRIPLTLSKPQGDGTCWLTFAKDVLSEEDATGWILNGPSLDGLHPKQVVTLRREATKTATQIRGIANDLMTADVADDADRAMAASVLRHLDKAASDICAPSHESSSLAVWDLHMACEKVMKAYLTQERVAYPMTHDLRKLNRLAPAKHDWSAVKLTLGNFPSEARVMQWRYQEIVAPSVEELWRFYGVALQVCSTYASRMSRKWTFNNFSVHLKKPPWLGGDTLTGD